MGGKIPIMNKRLILYILVILLSITFLTVLRFYLPPTQSELDENKLKGKILFCIGKSYYLMNANATNIRKIDVERRPVFSPQAKKVAWIIYKASNIFSEKEMAVLIMDVDGKNNKIFEVNIDDGTLNKREIGDKPPWLWGLRWSKNEEEVTLYYRERIKKNPRYYKIALNAITGDTRIVKELSQIDQSDYEDYYSGIIPGVIDSPDGTKTFTKGDRGDNGGYLIDKLSGKKTYLDASYRYSHISWSLNSNKLVYAKGGDIYTLNSDGTNFRNLTHYKYPWYADPYSGRGGYEEPSWSPDSRYICCTYIARIGIGLFTSPSYEIRIIDTITGKIIFLTNGNNPMWLPEEFNIPECNIIIRDVRTLKEK